MPGQYRRIGYVDSHTGGEPTRTIIDGFPDLGSSSLAKRRDVFRTSFDKFRSAVVNEPRGSDAVVGALLCEPVDPACAAGVIFFNNVGYLGMCGHGTIGIVATLAYLGRISTGHHRLETPVGVISAELHENGEVSIANVPSFRLHKNVKLTVPSFGEITGDVAWGGNWFFLTKDTPCNLELSNLDLLTDYTARIRSTLAENGITGIDGLEIDHIEITGPGSESANAKNFVLCPGKSYDRSPCGTGTSAKLACLAADGQLKPGETWIQEGITGSVFVGQFSNALEESKILPTVTGRAYINAEGVLLLDPEDPLQWGICPP